MLSCSKLRKKSFAFTALYTMLASVPLIFQSCFLNRYALFFPLSFEMCLIYFWPHRSESHCPRPTSLLHPHLSITFDTRDSSTTPSLFNNIRSSWRGSFWMSLTFEWVHRIKQIAVPNWVALIPSIEGLNRPKSLSKREHLRPVWAATSTFSYPWTGTYTTSSPGSPAWDFSASTTVWAHLL